MTDNSSATSNDQNEEIASFKTLQPPKQEQKVVFGESHSVQITTFRLNGSNYLRWSQSVQMYIRGRGKLGYLNGEQPKPEISDPQHNVWDAENSMVMTWLVNSMEEEISSNYMCYSTAKELWDSVTEMYSDLGNKSQVYELTLKAREIQQGNDNVTRYFHSLKRVWQDLDLFSTYKWKSTEDSKYHKQTVEEGRIFQFLAGLNEELDEVRGRIIGRATLPSLGEIFAEVRREETRRSVMMGKTKADPPPQETNALAVEATALRSSTNQRNSSNLWCDHCNKPRHTRETCWKIHGKPAHLKGSKPGPRAPRPLPTAHEAEKTSLSKEHVQELIRLLKSSSFSDTPSGSLAQTGNFSTSISLNCTSNMCVPWIIDSGASDHMTSLSSLYKTYSPCSGNKKIRIADGSFSSIAGEGRITLSNQIDLKNVLHVPKLSCNLLSISKICKDSKCNVKFFDTHCIFQDRISGKMIGSAKMMDGLYYFEDAFENKIAQGLSGALDEKGLQVYAFSLWRLGENDLALSVARSLAASLSSMEKTSVATSICFICRLVYFIRGLDAVIASIVKIPKELFQSSKVSFVMSAINALDGQNRLGMVVSSTQSFLKYQEEIARVHFLIALGKLVKNEADCCLDIQSGIAHLRKALHMFPNCNLMRNLLGYLLLSSKELNNCHVATRCCKLDRLDLSDQEGLKSAYEIHGAGAVACYATDNSNPKFAFPTCTKQCSGLPGAIKYLQRCIHQKPWSHDARYLLVLNYLQRAREHRFPHHLCGILNRLIPAALSNELYSKTEMFYQYRHFQLLLCASEISLQCGDHMSGITHAKKAAQLVLPDDYLFFAHLLLCRLYAMKGDHLNFRKEYITCLKLRTDCHIGWMCLKLMECLCELQIDSNVIDMNFEECIKMGGNSWSMWMATYNLVRGMISLQKRDLVSAEEFMAQACSLAGYESCLFLCHGAICMELVRQCNGPQFLSQAVKSLTKVHELSLIPLPFASVLMAQAEGSLGSKERWERNLRCEWYTWPSEMRPAELYFQMHLLARQLKVGPSTISSMEPSRSPQRWVIRAIHMNPSCMRYWRVLQKLMEET